MLNKKSVLGIISNQICFLPLEVNGIVLISEGARVQKVGVGREGRLELCCLFGIIYLLGVQHVHVSLKHL